MIDMIELLDWHRDKFPLASVDSQRKHLEQEIKEFEEADETHVVEELADIYIVAVSLYRWDDGEKLGNDALNFYFYNFNDEWRSKILEAVENKVNVVNSRKYFWNGLDYDRKR